MSGFQGFGCCSALFSPLIQRADIQPSKTTLGALGIKGLHTDFRKGKGKVGKISERWAPPKRYNIERMNKRKRWRGNNERMQKERSRK